MNEERGGRLIFIVIIAGLLKAHNTKVRARQGLPPYPLGKFWLITLGVWIGLNVLIVAAGGTTSC